MIAPKIVLIDKNLYFCDHTSATKAFTTSIKQSFYFLLLFSLFVFLLDHFFD